MKKRTEAMNDHRSELAGEVAQLRRELAAADGALVAVSRERDALRLEVAQLRQVSADFARGAIQSVPKQR